MTTIIASSRADLRDAMRIAAGRDPESRCLIKFFNRHTMDVKLVKVPTEIPMLSEKSYYKLRSDYVANPAEFVEGLPESVDDITETLIETAPSYDDYIEKRQAETRGEVLDYEYPPMWRRSKMGVCAVPEEYAPFYGLNKRFSSYLTLETRGRAFCQHNRMINYSQAPMTLFWAGMDLLQMTYVARAMPTPQYVPSAPQVYLRSKQLMGRLLNSATNNTIQAIAASVHRDDFIHADLDKDIERRNRVLQAREMVLERMVEVFGDAASPLEERIREDVASWEIMTYNLPRESVMALIILSYGVDGSMN